MSMVRVFGHTRILIHFFLFLVQTRDDPFRSSLRSPRLATEESMRNSAEAYIKGSLDVSDMLNGIHSVAVCQNL